MIDFRIQYTKIYNFIWAVSTVIREVTFQVLFDAVAIVTLEVVGWAALGYRDGGLAVNEVNTVHREVACERSTSSRLNDQVKVLSRPKEDL